MGNQRVEDVGLLVLALGREIAPAVCPGIDDVGARLGRFGYLVGIEQDEAALRQPVFPFARSQIERVRLERTVGRGVVAAAVLERGGTRGVVIEHLLVTLAVGLAHQRIEQHRNAGGVVEYAVEALVEKRQPVLHALVAMAR